MSVYFDEIRAWVDAHPSEIVVLWVSKHGNNDATGDDAYPGVTVAEKQDWWARIEDVFAGVLVDFRISRLNETRVADMVQRNHRVAIYASDWAEMTGESPFALDARLIDNSLGTQAYSDAGAWQRSSFNQSQTRIHENDKPRQSLYLMSMAGYPSDLTEQVEVSIANRFLGTNRGCEKAFDGFPQNGTVTWCPPTLVDIAQLENYYSQRTLQEALDQNWGFPNAIYINGLDWDGSIRTGKTPH